MQDNSNANKEPSSTMLYVSNLPFSYEDGNLREIFKGFDVTSAYVATRRNGRSKGFGFVTFGSSDQQKKALSQFDGKDLEGRTLTVKIAHKDDRRDAKGELRDEFKTQKDAAPRGRRNNGNNKEGGGNGGGGGGNDRKPQSEKKPSETILYVSNLPFEFTDADLSKVFAAHNPTSARIARRKNDRSKGFGFVEFGNHNDQQKALQLDGHNLNERQISVKVSLVGDDNGNNDGGNNSGAGNRERKPRNNGNNNNNNNNNNGGERNNDRNKNNNQNNNQNNNNNNNGGNSNSETTVYVSNLPFDLSDDQLADVFRSRGFNPTSARIARRRDERSKGFGFVEFANSKVQADALSVDQASLGERTISVKIAKKDSETARDNSKGGNNNGNNNGNNGNNRRNNGNSNNNNGNNNNNNNDNDGGEGGKKKRRRNRKKGGNGGENDSNNNGGNNNNNGNRGERREGGRGEGGQGGERQKRTVSEKKNSDTLVYVSNLDFDVDDNVLAKLFDGFTIKSAHVAVRRNGRSKGFGFVEFNTHDDQQKALSKSGADLKGRKVVVEVAKEAVGGQDKN